MDHKQFERILLIVIILISIGAGSIYYLSNNTPYKGEGKIDIGGYSLYVKVVGEGSPTVVFESGLGVVSTENNPIAGIIQEHTRVVAYNRAGLGESDVSPYNRTSEQKATELHKLLKEANIKPPYVLVANGYSGYNVRMFAAKYPKEVAGVIWVTPISESFLDIAKTLMSPAEMEPFMRQFKEQINHPSSKSGDGDYEELLTSMSQVKENSEALRNIPLTVILRDNLIDDPLMIKAFDENKKLSELSSKGKLVLIDSETTGIYNVTQIISDEIIDMLEKYKETK